ncbi:NAD(P)/FAD-dependent oxidoreductase [Streptosporangium sp. CA-115845]|uniref:NAD(P)/FAD-dependent oxidoreductase n=1 Tax=Streptosporangium sp. CA-115845 TaxID=3240071 RepID=UPI003D8C1EA3
MAKTVIVLGAGVGGLNVASQLRDRLPGSDKVVLIDQTFEGALGLSMLWVLRGWRTAADITVRPGQDALPGVEMVKAKVRLIEPDRRKVVTDAGEFSCDALVIALGADLAPSAVPGLTKALEAGQAGDFYTVEGSAWLQDRVRRFSGGRLAVLVAATPFKCPAAPFEAALLLADLLRETGARDNVSIETYTPDPLPMPVAGPVVGQALVDMLTAHGIGFHGQRTIERVDGGAGELVFADGSREGFDLLAVAPPHRPPAAVRGTSLGPAGWIPVDARTFATNSNGVWALGDVTSLTLPNGKPLPKAAVFAEEAAKVVTNGVLRHLGYEAPEPWFGGLGSCYIELGDHLAAKGEGEFLAVPAPRVTLYEPSAEFHEEKAAQETDWLKRWNS